MRMENEQVKLEKCFKEHTNLRPCLVPTKKIYTISHRTFEHLHEVKYRLKI
jgi:hypothetical protein